MVKKNTPFDDATGRPWSWPRSWPWPWSRSWPWFLTWPWFLAWFLTWRQPWCEPFMHTSDLVAGIAGSQFQISR